MPTDIERTAATKELLLADLAHFEESIWRNEEIGEKRFTFFVTLATFIGGGLVAMWTADTPALASEQMHSITTAACLSLLVFGLLSFYRMMHRDQVTAEYKRTTEYIRGKYKMVFAEDGLGLTDYELPLDRLRRNRERLGDLAIRVRRIRQAGYTPTLGALNGVLLSALIVSADNWRAADAAWPGGMLAVVLCYVGARPYRE